MQLKYQNKKLNYEEMHLKMTIIKIEGIPGEDISMFAKRLVELNTVKENDILSHFAQLTSNLTNIKHVKDEIVGSFNGISLKVSATSTVASIVQDYSNQINSKKEAYLNSQELKDSEQKNKIKLEKLNNDVIFVINKLIDLDFQDSFATLKWMSELQPYSYEVGVNIPTKEIVEKFASYGYVINANTDEEFNGENKDNYARYIIGQCLAGLSKSKEIHPIMHDFLAKWEAKFMLSV
jgi:hypothetical protein